MSSIQTLQAEADAARNGIPIIETTDRYMHEISNDCITALQKENARGENPRFFLRGAEAISIIRIKKENGALIADPLNRDALKGELDRCARFVKHKGKQPAPARVPDVVVADILSLASLDLPRLSGVSGVPVFVPGGKFLAKNGYDPESGLYLNQNGIDELKTDMSLHEAVDWILTELLGDFPFVNQASRANAFAMTIQPFARSMVDGPTPLYAIDTPTPGTGKGLILETTSSIYLGKPVEATPLPASEEELEKRITALLLQAAQFVRFDNVMKIKSRALSAVLTTVEWRGRILGVSKMPLLKNDVRLWTACGNNPELSDEIARRTIPIRLDANSEHPELRTGFRHPDLLGWVLDHRPELVSACLSIVQAWIDAGMPRGTRTLGKFESWARIMGGILDVADVEGFLTERDLLVSSDYQRQEWRSLCEEWFTRHGACAVSATDILALAKERNVVLDVWAGRSELAGQQRMGHALWDRRGGIYSGFKIQSAGRDSNTGSWAYCLTRIQTPETPSKEPGLSGVQGVSGVSIEGSTLSSEAQIISDADRIVDELDGGAADDVPF